MAPRVWSPAQDGRSPPVSVTGARRRDVAVRALRHRLRLRDRRWLTFREVGERDGVPVMYCHGVPSSSAEWRLFGTAREIAALGIHLVAPDRPGIGGSTSQPRRSMAAWSVDVVELTQHLGWERFAVLGYSGGGPYALAIATRYPERVTALTTVSGSGRFDVPGTTSGIDPASLAFLSIARSRPWLADAASWMMGAAARLRPQQFLAQVRLSVPAADAMVLDDRSITRAFRRAVYEASFGSPHGARTEIALMTGAWGFDPADVRTHVRMWHGTADRNVPPAMARELAQRLQSRQLKWLEGEGHLSAAAVHARRILADLVVRARGNRETAA